MEENKKQELTGGEKVWFLNYIKDECEIVLSAWEELIGLKKYASENKLDKDGQQDCSLRMWRCISDLLLAYANISKTIDHRQNLKKSFFKHELDYWWSGKTDPEKEELYNKFCEEREVRVKTLNRMLSFVLNGQKLDRSPRNYLEHSDAFLQLYLIEYGTKVTTHKSFGCPDEKKLPENNLSFFHCRTDKVWLYGKPFPLEPVIQFIKKLEEAVKNELGKLTAYNVNFNNQGNTRQYR